MKVTKDKFRCDLCQRVYKESGIIPLAEGSTYQHICYPCMWDGWVVVCYMCLHDFPREELNVEGRCKGCENRLTNTLSML